MPDRIPIGTIPGLTAQLDGVDILIATLGVPCTVTRVLLRQTDYDDGGATDTSVTGSIRNATAGGGEGIAFVIPDQGQSVVATGTLVVDAGESIYLRVTAGNATSMNLTGWVEVSGAAGVTTALTSLARVKQFLNISGSADDDRLNTLIAAVSDEIQGYLGRRILQTTATSERLTPGYNDHRIVCEHHPIVSITSVYESDVLLVDGTDYEAKTQDLDAGIIVRISGGDPTAWTGGTRGVVVTYDYGYATVPSALQQAATELVAYDYHGEKSSGSRFGLTGKSIDTGGGSAYLTRDQIWTAQAQRMWAYRRQVWL